MSALWEYLGYDSVAEQISAALQRGSRLVLLEGHPGVGKSWLARGVAAAWETAGGASAVAEGDELRCQVSLLPFNTSTGSLGSALQELGRRASGVAKAAEALAGTAGLLTALVEGVVRLRRHRRLSKLPFIGDEEQQILFDLQKLSGGQPLLLVADNLHWWDSDSLLLLQSLLSAEMQAALPFLDSLRVLGVRTAEDSQRVLHPEAYERSVGRLVDNRFALPRIRKQQFRRVLEILGAPSPVSPEVVDQVFALSGGHLALASRAAVEMAEHGPDALHRNIGDDDFVTRIFTERIHALGDSSHEILELLSVASVIGLSFRRDELVCTMAADPSRVRKLLGYCSAESLLAVTNGTCRFVHDIYRRFFLKRSADKNIAIREKLGDCLRKLQPSNYRLRATNAERAEDPVQASVFGVCAALQNLRKGRSWDEGIDSRVLVGMNRAPFDGYLRTMRSALQLLKNYQHRACLATLERLPRDVPTILAAEADYVRAMCRMSTRRESDREKGRSILEAWSGFEHTEAEAGLRLARLHLYGLTHLLDKTAARRLEGALRRALIDRVGFDRSAQDQLYVMDRCAASLYQPDIACVRTREAVEFYGDRPEGGLLRHPVEYYRCLVNYGANLISNARYDDAVEIYARIENLLDEYEENVFPRLDYPLGSKLLAELRLGRVDPDDAVRRQLEILDEHAVAGDPFYGKNALAVYLTLACRYDAAKAVFRDLAGHLAARGDTIEPSMEYLIRANWCACRHVWGSEGDLVAEWHRLSDLVHRIAYVFRPILVRRHELLKEAFEKVAPGRPNEWDRYLLDQPSAEFGPLWDNFGRGFRMPEVEFWRDN